MAIIATQPLTTRAPGPYAKERRCSKCNCLLSRYNPSQLCSPCQPALARVQARALIRELMEQATP